MSSLLTEAHRENPEASRLYAKAFLERRARERRGDRIAESIEKSHARRKRRKAGIRIDTIEPISLEPAPEPILVTAVPIVVFDPAELPDARVQIEPLISSAARSSNAIPDTGMIARVANYMKRIGRAIGRTGSS